MPRIAGVYAAMNRPTAPTTYNKFLVFFISEQESRSRVPGLAKIN